MLMVESVAFVEHTTRTSSEGVDKWAYKNLVITRKPSSQPLGGKDRVTLTKQKLVWDF